MTETAITAELLKTLPLFSEVSRKSLAILAGRCRLESFEEGDLIFAEGHRGDRMFVVLEGAVNLSRDVEGVGEELYAVCREGSYFGELSMIDDSPRSADARVLESTTVMTISKAAMEELMFQDPSFAREILWVMTRHLAVRLRETGEKLRAVYQMQL